jgi:hypothetical protein
MSGIAITSEGNGVPFAKTMNKRHPTKDAFLHAKNSIIVLSEPSCADNRKLLVARIALS